MNLRTAKLLGGIGGILSLCAIIPTIGWLLGIAGIILVLISVKNISDITKEKKIFSRFLLSFVLGIVNGVVVIIGIFISIFTIFRQNSPWFWERLSQGFRNWDWGEFENWANSYFSTLNWPQFIYNVLMTIIILFVISWIINIISAYFLKSSFDEITNKTQEKNFSTSGLLIFIGAIIPFLGLFVAFVGNIFKIIAFFSLPDTLEKPEEQKLE